MNDSKHDLALAIVDFLKTSLSDGTIQAEDKDSVDVAIECLTDVFGIKSTQRHSGESLLSIFTQNSTKSPAKDTAKDTAKNTAKDTPKDTPKDTDSVSAQDKEAAEAFKVDGNRSMAQKNFEQAVELYSKAIDKDPSNAIYYSNRSAAYSSLRKPQQAIEDAQRAVTLDPGYAKGYSRLGLALYSLGDAQGSMEAYQKGMEVEGEPSDAMRRGYETAKKRVEEELESAVPKDAAAPSSSSASASAASSTAPSAASSNGLPDLSSLLGGGMGGMGDMMSSLMKNPQMAEMARSLMSNPAMSEMARKAQEEGKMPNIGDLMSNPELMKLAQSMGGMFGQPPK